MSAGITVTQILPLAVAALEFGAGLVYLYHRDWWSAMVWCFYGLAAVGLAKVGG